MADTEPPAEPEAEPEPEPTPLQQAALARGLHPGIVAGLARFELDGTPEEQDLGAPFYEAARHIVDKCDPADASVTLGALTDLVNARDRVVGWATDTEATTTG